MAICKNFFFCFLFLKNALFLIRIHLTYLFIDSYTNNTKQYNSQTLIYCPLSGMSTRFTKCFGDYLYFAACLLALKQLSVFRFFFFTFLNSSSSFFFSRQRFSPDAAYLINFYDLLHNENEFVIYLSFHLFYFFRLASK